MSHQIRKKPIEVDERGRPRFHGCSNVRDYELQGKLGEGTFGEVWKATSRKNVSVFALKKILVHNEKDGFPITALREIRLLKMLSHPNVLKLEEMAVERIKGEGRKKATIYMVTPYMDHDLSGLLENPDVRFTEPQIKCYMLQLLEGLRYLHDHQILHRDMKAANLLINNKGILQIADFGLARHYDGPPPRPGKGNGEAKRDYTSLVVTRWYRPPELLLQLRKYTPAIDLWGVGCVFGEMFMRKPILAGTSDLNQIQIIFDLVGSPTEDNMPGWTSLPGCEGVREFRNRPSNLAQRFREQGSSVISLLSELLKLDWRKRINAVDALKHPYFTSDPLPAKPGELPKFEASHELDRRRLRGQQQRPALPPAPAGGSVGMAPKTGWANGPPTHRRDTSGNGNINGYNRRGERDWHGSGANNNKNNWDHPPAKGGSAVPSAAPPRHPDHPGPPERQPAWARDNNNNHGLPPRPPPPARVDDGGGIGGGPGGRDRGPPPRGGGREPRVDTYIPNYSNGAHGAQGGGGGGGGWGDGPGPGPRRGEPHHHHHHHQHHQQDRGRGGGPDRSRDWDRRKDERRRSRSPSKLDRGRDRTREREWDIYRR
ncbi:MAG: serine/threonine protein kinase, CMGC, CDC2/CDK sub [Peltula sp. TS41687]|nr:MAG: serine/threonine protein kinase, CMGC, CDC2/CDK sub [Peltula sp. TS41687]